MNILLVEPDSVLAQIYAAALEQAGHCVVAKSSAQEAVHAIDEALPDLILLEIQLINHSGIEFLYELRSYADWQKVPVILHTFVPASALRLGQETLQTLGINAYLYKPQTTLQQLLSLIVTIPENVHA